MSKPKDTLHIHVTYFTGQEEGDEDVGHPYYVASCEEIVAVTDGATWAELMHNIHEMLRASFEREDTVAAYGLVANPRILITPTSCLT